MTNVPPSLADIAGPKTFIDADISFRIPEGMHSLGLDLSPEDRAEHIRHVADEVWAAGTDYQRETTAQIYSEVADSAAEDGALYAGVAFLALDDGQPASASLVVRAEATDKTDADVVAHGIVEGLSAQPGKEAYRTTAAGRPVAVVFSVVGAALDDEDTSTLDAVAAPVLPVATAEAYVPLPQISQLVVLGISTPTLEIFPDLVALLSGITETLEVGATSADGASDDSRRAPGAVAPRPSRISEL
ncbi:hypothetical protein [Streptomyces montanisoli]|uniref:Uncharacterized protein n=1 Tax=Streptomyces montanisoli TaxID=2798581 RepID=A0A940MHG6_9ACTN|nr:hypothetical protein [Streptomyces montanisoli]MBP0458673.1 hypothetical protein [Streptomyces montanisoli]